MKRTLKAVIIIALVLCTVTGSYAQKQKLGHIDSNELLNLMPGKDSAQAILTDYAKTLENQLKGMQTEFDTKYQDYLANEANMTELIKQTLQKELQDIQARIESFQEQAQADLEKRQNELLQPIIDKAKSAIESVSKANGYTYIFDSGLGILLYTDQVDNILPLVKKELGLQ